MRDGWQDSGPPAEGLGAWQGSGPPAEAAASAPAKATAAAAAVASALEKATVAAAAAARAAKAAASAPGNAHYAAIARRLADKVIMHYGLLNFRIICPGPQGNQRFGSIEFNIIFMDCSQILILSKVRGTISPEPRPRVAGCLTERIPPRWPHYMYKSNPDEVADVTNDIHCVFIFACCQKCSPGRP